MSCWVVPTIAAELWGVPLEQVLGEIRAGAVVSKRDYGFTLVDVAPDSRKIAPPPAAKPLPPPKTFVAAAVLEEAEEVALALAESLPSDSIAPDGVITQQTLLPAVPATECASTEPVPAEPAPEPAAALPAEAIPAAPAEGATSGVTETSGFNARRVRRIDAGRPFRSTPAVPGPSEEVEHESEDGPDPNFGEPDDGRPLNWREARTRAAATRRRPPTRFN